MLRTAFIGSNNRFDQKLCEWLSEHSDLRLILWTNKLSWGNAVGGNRYGRVLSRFVKRSKKLGVMRAVNEAAYYGLYRRTLAKAEVASVVAAASALPTRPRRPVSEIEQVWVTNLKDPALHEQIRAHDLDAAFAMCIDAYLPPALYGIPKRGTYLWHEGITPEYRGVYSPFWALVQRDYDNLGYTLLKMNDKLDAGAVYVQGRAEGIDPRRDWHNYIGHKAILDSLPAVKSFLEELERNDPKPIDAAGRPEGYYSYPTATAFLKLALDRWREKR